MYTYDIGAQSMFDDRTAQFEKFGISLDDINSVRSRVTDMWADEPGGWVHEWPKLAERYADKGEHPMARTALRVRQVPVPDRRGTSAGVAQPTGAI